jgi:hypothetical protein
MGHKGVSTPISQGGVSLQKALTGSSKMVLNVNPFNDPLDHLVTHNTYECLMEMKNMMIIHQG